MKTAAKACRLLEANCVDVINIPIKIHNIEKRKKTNAEKL